MGLASVKIQRSASPAGKRDHPRCRLRASDTKRNARPSRGLVVVPVTPKEPGETGDGTQWHDDRGEDDESYGLIA
jgi:hypothetical protein